jgi:class 3 adenylate cyclase/putative methionine-R-sulfoxide reductase with GAF domain
MVILDSESEKRNNSRRVEDFLVREKLRKHSLLLNVGQIITSVMNMYALFEVIMEQTNQIMDTRRSTVFLYDEKSSELWSMVATGMERNEIRIPSDYGVAGWVFQRKAPLTINDAYNDPRFYSKVDKQSGFITDNILCVPLINRKGKCIGALQTLNKNAGEFSNEDEELLRSISHYVTIALENSRLYEEVKDYSEELKNTLIRIETLERVKGQLTKFVPSSVTRLLEQNPDQLANEKIEMNVTVLFIDIQGFSKITEVYEQRLVNDMVECHFSSYLDCIKRHGGEVNETSGDGLMVIFKEGPIESHAKEAVSAGLEIVSENRRLNKDSSYPWGRVDLHMGINSGEAFVGATKMKSLTGERWTYTASGIVTVLAARIGALSSETRLFVGPGTYQYIENECQDEFIGAKRVKNVKNTISIYWVKNFKNKSN